MEHDNMHARKMMNLWMALTIIFAILFLISLFFNFRSPAVKGGPGISESAASEKTLNFINKYILSGKATATSLGTKQESGLYVVSLDIGGQQGQVYVTKDGKYLFNNPIDLDTPPKPINQTIQKVNASFENAPIEGNQNATVTIVEFSDFECPFCGKFFKEAYQQIKQQYIDTGKVRVAYRHFPLEIHANAMKAAQASECANEQGKFWEMHDLLFKNQNALKESDLKKYASQIGLDTTKFNECLDSDKYKEKIQKDISDGISYGVSGTPTFFINGIRVVGALPFENFKEIIDGELAK